MRVIAGLFLVLLTQQSFGLTYNTFTDRATWAAAAVTTATTITQEDFNTEATGTFSTRTFSGFTVTKTSPNIYTAIDSPGSANVNGSRFLLLFSNADNTPMQIVFNSPISALGFDWKNTDNTGDTAQLRVVVDGVLHVFGAAGNGFFGLIATDGVFSTIEIEDTAGNGGVLMDLGIDDISWDSPIAVSPIPTDIPTLSQWGLIVLVMLLAMLGQLGMRRRREF